MRIRKRPAITDRCFIRSISRDAVLGHPISDFIGSSALIFRKIDEPNRVCVISIICYLGFDIGHFSLGLHQMDHGSILRCCGAQTVLVCIVSPDFCDIDINILPGTGNIGSRQNFRLTNYRSDHVLIPFAVRCRCVSDWRINSQVPFHPGNAGRKRNRYVFRRIRGDKREALPCTYLCFTAFFRDTSRK